MNWIRNRAATVLILCGLIILGLSIWLSFLSSQFDFDDAFVNRPVIAVVVGLVFGSIVWLLGCAAAKTAKLESKKWILLWIVGIGIASRVALVFSTPILEIDLYRYLWDGNVSLTNGDPYEYAPIEFFQWNYSEEDRIPFARDEMEHQWLQEFALEQDQSMRETLQIMTTHFGQFTSPYPPVSQAVFAISQLSCPRGSSLKTRVSVLKAWLVLFDIATGFVLILLLRQLKLPSSMSIVWFWCPLVLKEIANGGHLDSITIFLTTTFVYFAVKQIAEPERKFRWSFIAGIFLALAVAAKIYPIVLVPLWAIVTLRRFSLKTLASWIVSALLIVALMAPMLGKVLEYRSEEVKSKPTPGVLAFAESWEMNDFLFMLVVENLKPSVAKSSGEPEAPWFVVTSDQWRSQSTFQKAFSQAKWITNGIFLLIVIWSAWYWWRCDESRRPEVFVECVFLTLAWFWLLAPTQNPWYWCWAMPFLPFARSRVWYLVPATTPLYYLRYWFDYQLSDTASFDFNLPVVEFAPILLLLLAATVKNWVWKAEIVDQNGK